MEEKVLKKSKNGLAMVTLFILLYAAAIAAIIVGSIMAEQAETKAGWVIAERLLMSVGRRPVTKGFGLENLNLDKTARGNIQWCSSSCSWQA